MLQIGPILRPGIDVDDLMKIIKDDFEKDSEDKKEEEDLEKGEDDDDDDKPEQPVVQ